MKTRLGAELPAQARAWYDIANGLDYHHPQTTSWPSANLFPGLWARSVDEAIHWIDLWEGIRDSLDFIDGCRRCAEAGHSTVVDGGRSLDEDQRFVICRTTSYTQAVLCGFGFDPTAPLPLLFGTQRPTG